MIRKASEVAYGMARTGAETEYDLEITADAITTDRLAIVGRLREMVSGDSHPALELRRFGMHWADQLESEIRAASEDPPRQAKKSPA